MSEYQRKSRRPMTVVAPRLDLGLYYEMEDGTM
jgi:hypothetical protein